VQGVTLGPAGPVQLVLTGAVVAGALMIFSAVLLVRRALSRRRAGARPHR